MDPLLPPATPKPKGGRPPVPNQNAMRGILFVLKTGIRWADLPKAFQAAHGAVERRADIHLAFLTLAACMIRLSSLG
ncbi:MAG: transposase [Holophaga sp.]|nr:transposase [Holophaga sp.]